MMISELDNLPLEELIALFYQPNSSEKEDLFLQEVAAAIRKNGPPGNDFLIEELQKIEKDNVDDENRLLAVLVTLSSRPSRNENIKALTPIQKTIFRKKLSTFLTNTRWRIVMQALIALRLGNKKGAFKQAVALRHHPFQFVRESALEYLGKVYPEKSFELLMQALKDESHYVRQTAVDELGMLGNAEAIPALRKMFNDPEPDVRESAERAIDNLQFDNHMSE